MSIQNWSENITVVELADDPQFSDELNNLIEALEKNTVDVVLNFSGVSFINSSNIAKLLRVRKLMITWQRRLILCGVNTQTWGVFLVTGLDKIFEFTNDVSTALATLQLGSEREEKGKEA